MRDNLRAVGAQDHVTIVQKTSADALAAWTQKIDILFIDGDHSYEGAKADWSGFKPFVNPFGVVIFHDTLWDRRPDPRWQRDDMGVPRLVEEIRAQGYPVITLDRDFGVSLVQPTKSGQSLAAAATSAASSSAA
jgi:predicted O-methyltransferase YrrM